MHIEKQKTLCRPLRVSTLARNFLRYLLTFTIPNSSAATSNGMFPIQLARTPRCYRFSTSHGRQNVYSLYLDRTQPARSKGEDIDCSTNGTGQKRTYCITSKDVEMYFVRSISMQIDMHPKMFLLPRIIDKRIYHRILPNKCFIN